MRSGAGGAGRWRLAVVLAAYGVAFALLHRLAGLWASAEFYSLFFLPAGLRFAFLWRMGATYAPVVALVEALATSVAGLVATTAVGEVLLLISMITAPLSYGAAILCAKRLSPRGLPVSRETVQFAVAALLAPFFAFLAVAPWLSGPQIPLSAGGFRHWLRVLLIFVSGDSLPILLIAPPLLWLGQHWAERRWPRVRLSSGWMTASGILAIGVAFALAGEVGGLGVRMSPVVIAVGVIGAVYGRTGACLAVSIVSLVVLTLTARMGDQLDVELHQQLAAIAFIGFIAGSYPPHWIPAELIWKLMRTIDQTSGLARGWVVLRRGDPVDPAMFETCC